MKRNNKGFTLVELLAAIVILGILVAVSVPVITGLMNDSRSKMYISDAKKLASLVEYKINANSSVIEKPDEGDCILVSMLYVDSADFDNPPGEGEYLRESSYVVVKNKGGNLEYSATIVEKVKKGGYKGVSLVRKNDLSKRTAKNHVVTFKKGDILNVETDVNRGYINEKLGKDYMTADDSISAIYNYPDLTDKSSSSSSSVIPKIVYASILSNSNKYYNSLEATLQIRVDDRDTPRNELKVYLNVDEGYNESGTPMPYGSDDIFSYNINFGDYNKTYNGDSVKLYLIVKDPQGNSTKKTITYKIHKNESPEIGETAELTRRDMDVYHDVEKTMLRAKLKFPVSDDIDENDNLMICFVESTDSATPQECSNYKSYYHYFDQDGLMEYQFTNCEGGSCRRDGSTHYLTVFVKDAMGGVTKRKFKYVFSINENPVLHSFTLESEEEHYTKTSSRTIYVKVNASDDVDDTLNGNGMYIEVSESNRPSTCSISAVNNNVRCRYNINHRYDGSTVTISVRMIDSEGGVSNVLTKKYTLYTNEDPEIHSFPDWTWTAAARRANDHSGRLCFP